MGKTMDGHDDNIFMEDITLHYANATPIPLTPQYCLG